MAIENLGSKLYSGTKTDRVSDSLGSSADGTNSGITQSISLNSSTNKVDFDAKRDGNNYAMSYDLGATISDTQWVARFPVTISTLTGNSGQNTLFMFFGLSSLDAKTGATSGSFDYIGTQLKKSSGASLWKAQAVDGGALNVEGTDFAHTLTTQTYYVEIKRTGATSATVELFSDSGYSSSIESESLTPASTIQNLRYIWIGNQDSSGGTTNKIVGTVGEIKVWNSTTTASGTATYTASPNSTTNWTSGSAKLGTGAYEFDGTDDKVETGDKFGFLTQTGSIAFWMKPTTFNDNDVLFDSCNASSGNNGVLCKVASASNLITFLIARGGSSSNLNYTFGSDPSGKWTHLAFTYDGTTAKIYENGSEVASGSVTSTTNTPTHNLHFGEAGAGQDGNYDGLFDDIGIWNRVLTATEIGKLANNNGEENYLSQSSTGQKQLDESANKYGIKLASDNPLIGKTLKSITFSMKKNNSPTGSVQAKIYKNDSTSATATSTTTLNVSTLTTSFVDKTFEFASGVTLASGDRIVVEGGSHDGTNQIMFEQHTTSFSDTVTIARYTSSWVDGISGDFLYKLTSTNTDAQLVSSLTNKSNLKAYYSMDSTSMSSLYSTDFTSDSNNALWSVQDSTKIDVNDSNDRLEFDIRRDTTNDSISYDLGSALNSDKWTIRFKINYNSWTGSGTPALLGFYGISDKDSSSAANVSQDFIGLVTRVNGASQGEFFGYAVSDSTLGEPSSNQIGSAGKVGSVGSPASTNWGVEIKRTSATACIVNIYDNHNFTGTPDNSGSISISTAYTGFRYLVVKNNSPSSSNQSGLALGGYISDIEVWDGSEAVGCANDHSATSDLDALTGVRTNSIFQQTDDTPTYWWYNGTSWLLDGTTDLYSSDFANNSTGWSTSNSRGGFDSTGAWAYNETTTPSNSAKVNYDLGVNVGTKFILRWRMKLDSGTQPNNYGYFWIATEDSLTPSNYTGFVWKGPDSKVAAGKNIGDPSTTFSISSNTWYYFEITRSSIGSGGGVLKSYSDSTYSGTGTTIMTFDTTGGGSERYLQLKATHNGNNSTKHYVDAIQLQNGTSEWLE